jgi:RNA polymerase sigma-70 factor (ECF subfamily)
MPVQPDSAAPNSTASTAQGCHSIDFCLGAIEGVPLVGDAAAQAMAGRSAAMMERSGSGVAVVERVAPRDSSLGVRRLVRRAQAGERAALEQLYLLHFDRIYSYLHLSVGNRHDAEDLTNQTFIRMLERIDRFVWRHVPFSAWLFRIAHNLAMDHFRAGRRWQPESDPPESPDSVEPSAEDAAMHAIGQESLFALIERLSHDQQQVLTLKFAFDFSNAEVAAILGKTEGAIKSLQHRALASLERQLARSR